MEDSRKKRAAPVPVGGQARPSFLANSGLGVYDSPGSGWQWGFCPGHFSGFVVRRAIRRFVLAQGCHLRKGGRSGSDRT